MQTKKILLWLGILTIAGIILSVFAQEIFNITLVPNLDISRFAPYQLSVTTSGDILSGEMQITAINGDGGNCIDYYASGWCAVSGGISSFTGELTYSWDNIWVSNNIYPDSIYPEVYFADSSITRNNTPQEVLMSRNSYEIMYFTNPFTMENNMSFFMELNLRPRSTANSQNLLVYVVEKNKNINFFSSERRNHTWVELIGSFSRTALPHHTHTANSAHYLIPLSTNGDGTIGTKHIDIRDNFWIVTVANTWLPSKWRYLRYQSSALCQNTSGRYQWDLDTRNITRQSWCPDVHFHIARRGDHADGLTANVTMYASWWSIVTGERVESFAPLPNLAPNTTSFITPTSGSYTGDIYISRYPSIDPNGDSVTYTIYLTDTWGNELETLTGNISTTGFYRDSTSTGDGIYNLKGEVCDTSLCNTFNLTDDFLVDNIEDPDTFAPAVNITSGQYFSGDVYVEVIDEHYSGTLVTYNSSDTRYTTTGFMLTGEGYYILTAYDTTGNFTTVGFTIDKTMPTFTGVISGTTYYTGVIIEFFDNNEWVTATLSGGDYTWWIYTSGTLLTTTGEYIIIITDNAGNSTGAIFTITDPDTNKPTATIDYYPASWSRTNTDVLAVITGFSEEITWLNVTQYLFTGNGIFLFTFNDLAGNTGEALATVDRIDKEVPIVNINGSSTVYIELGNNYTELWAKRTDNIDGTWDISIISGNVNTWVIGTYELEYIYIDQAGNTGTDNRTVIVEDTTKPTATIEYTPWSGTRTNTNVLAVITWFSENVTWLNATGYLFTSNDTFTFTFEDIQWNTGEVIATVNWIDKTNPVVTINWSGTIYIEYGDSYTELWATRSDNADGTWDVNIISGTVNTGTIWTYELQYIYVDEAGNTGIDSRIVIVQDTTKPTASIEYTPISWSRTSGNVLAVITWFSEEITGLNTTGYTFITNSSFIFTFEDLAGNTGAITATVNRIDKTAPIINATGTITTTTGTATIEHINITETDAWLASARMEYSWVYNSTITWELQLTTWDVNNLTWFIAGLDHNATYTYTITFTDNIGNSSFITGIFETIIDRNIIYTEVRSGNVLSGIHTNLSTVTNDNVTNFTWLYLEIPSIGKIEILTGIDLTDPGTQTFLQWLKDTMIMENGYINFIVHDSSTYSGSAFVHIPATLTMRLTTAQFPNGTWGVENIVVRDNNGTILDSLSVLSNFICNASALTGVEQECSFKTSHFTSFGTRPTLPFVRIYSNNSNPWYAKIGDTITLSFSSSEPLTWVFAVIANNGATITGTGTNRIGNYTLWGGESEGNTSFSIDFEDFYNNTGITVTTVTDTSQVIIDFTPPAITNIISGQYFNTDITPIIVETNYSWATLNGSNYTSGTVISTEGVYELIVYDLAGNSSAVSFTIDTTEPSFEGVISWAYYSGNVTLTFSDTATLNGSGISSGDIISADWTYELIVTDLAGNSTGATFTIDTTEPTFAGVTSWTYYSWNKSITFSDTNLSWATLNGVPYHSGDIISADWTYELIITDLAGNSTGSIFTIDTTEPNFAGITSWAYYNTNKTIIFSDTNLSWATLNGIPYNSGDIISSEGTYVFVVEDLAGNTTGATFIIDTTEPTFRGVISGAYYNINKSIGFSDANISGATVNGIAYTSGSLISTDGTKVFIVTDKAGNSTWTTFTIDKTAPIVWTWIISVGNTGNNGTTLYYKGTITLSTTVSDTNLSGTSCQYSTGTSRASATYATGVCSIAWLTPAANINIRFRVRDLAGNLTTGGITTYNYDSTAPITTDNANSTTGATDVTVILSPIDTGVGLSWTRYCVDTWWTCTPTLSWTTISVTWAVGVITHKYIRYYSVDKLNNTETIKTSVMINIDKELPYLTGTTTFSSNNSTNSGYAKIGNTITIIFQSHEILTGTPIMTISWGSLTTGTVTNIGGNTYSWTYIMKAWDIEWPISFNITMTDLVGNTWTINITGTIIFDKTAPSGISITAPTTDTYLKGDPDVYVITWNTWTDAHLGPNSIYLEYSVTNFVSTTNITTGTANNWSYTFMFPNTLNTFAKIRIIATDLAGNVAYFTGNQFSIDNTPPTDITITYPWLYLKWASGYLIEWSWGIDANPQSIILSYTTNGTTFTTICTKTNNEQNCTWNTPSINSATVQLRTVATDKVGMSKQWTTPTFIVDSTAPTAIVFTDNNSNRRNTNATATGTSTDALAGLWTTGMVYRTTTAFTGNCEGGTTTTPTFTTDGYRTGYACIMDKAGNIRTGQQVYKIDKTPPALQIPTNSIANTGKIINITGTDTLAGISWYLRSKVSGPGTINFSPSTTTEDPTISANTDGMYVLKVVITDNAGNQTSWIINFIRDTTAPILTGATGVNNLTSQTPNYSFTTNETGTISYSGSCSSTTTTANTGTNTITFNALANGTYSNCQIRITDTVGNASARLNIPSFTVNYNAWGGWGWGWGGGWGGMAICTSSQLQCVNNVYAIKPGYSCYWGDLGKSCNIDVCVDGDYSWNPNDGLCQDPTKVETTSGSTSTSTWKRVLYTSPYNKELTDAYFYAFNAKITTVPDIKRADMTGVLIRSHLAKMMSEYVMKTLNKKPDTTRNCSFNDMNNQTEEFKKYAILACQLGLMGLKTDGTPATIFNPDKPVTRAIFWTTLSRALRWNTYNGGNNRYIQHLQALQNNGIMTQIQYPNNRELRGYVMLMMMRADQKVTKSQYLNFTSLRGQKIFIPNKTTNTTTQTTTNTTTPTTTTSSQFSQMELDFMQHINKEYQFTEGYKLGQISIGVKYLQYFLKAKKYYTWSINGINNTSTVEALFRFQVDNGIVETPEDQWAGYLWPSTRELINPLLKKLLNL